MAVTWITAQDLDNPASPNAEAAAETASWILYKLTAEKYAGQRTATEWLGLRGVDATLCPTFTDYGDFTWITYQDRASLRSVRLRGRPVISIQSVVTDSGVLDPSGYKLINSAVLYSNVDTWRLAGGVTVEYTYGLMPPRAGLVAARRLGNEIALAMEDSGNCALPQRVQSVSRQGMDFTVLDPQDFLEKGRTGIYEIDLFIAAANPTGARKKPRVFSPDLPRGERS